MYLCNCSVRGGDNFHIGQSFGYIGVHHLIEVSTRFRLHFVVFLDWSKHVGFVPLKKKK